MKKIVIVDGGPRKGMNTAQLLQRFAEVGGPRCCKRDSYLSILAAIDFVAANFGISMDKSAVVCRHCGKNNQCIRARCPFFPKNFGKEPFAIPHD